MPDILNPSGKRRVTSCERRAFSVKESSKKAGVSMPTLNRRLWSGEIPSFTIGRRRLIWSEDLDAYIEARLAENRTT